jgi:hypothetical protein
MSVTRHKISHARDDVVSDTVEKPHGGYALCLHGDVSALFCRCTARGMDWPKKVSIRSLFRTGIYPSFSLHADSLRYEKSDSLIPNEDKI